MTWLLEVGSSLQSFAKQMIFSPFMSRSAGGDSQEVLQIVQETKAACHEALRELAGTSSTSLEAIRSLDTESSRALVEQFAANRPSAVAALRRFLAQDDLDVNAEPFVRTVLIQAGLGALDRLAALPVDASVKRLLCDAFRLIAKPGRASPTYFRPDQDETARGLCSFVLLKRFPAGQLDWDVSGLPRSDLLKVPPRDWARVLYWVAVKLGGFAPCFVAHTGVRRYRLVFLERESNRSYYKMAKSMRLEPAIRGLIVASWFTAPETARASPHLAWTTRTPCEHGALLTTTGLAHPDSGFLIGSPERRELYEKGEYVPHVGLLIWPRRDLIAWAESHPEFADDGRSS